MENCYIFIAHVSGIVMSIEVRHGNKINLHGLHRSHVESPSAFTTSFYDNLAILTSGHEY